jgi:Mg-chelatase subunit ChlD
MQVNAFKLNETDVFVKIKGSESEIPMLPTHMIVVCDCSGSMEILSRLVNVKQSLHQMIPYMNESSNFSLVAFNTDAAVKCRAIPMNVEGKRLIEHKIDTLRAEGGTNLGAGLLMAHDLIVTTPVTHTINVLLLTDGEVTDGITEIPDLVNMVRGMREMRPSLTVHAIGYGTSHNFELMRSIAHESSGSYQVVENLEHVASVFGDILGGVMTIRAQNCEIMLPEGVTAITKLRTTTGVAGTNVQFGNLYAGAEFQLIVKSPVRVSNITSRWFDVVTRRFSFCETAVVIETNNIINTEADAYLLRMDAASMMDRISNQTATRDEMCVIVARLQNYPTIGWAFAIKAEIERILNIADRAPPSIPFSAILRSVEGAAANNSSVLSQGRGVAMMSQSMYDDDPMNAHTQHIDMFSTPTQRQVSGGLVRAVSRPPAAFSVALPPIPSIDEGAARMLDFEDLPPVPPLEYIPGTNVPLPPPIMIPSLPATFEEMVDPDRPMTPTNQIRRTHLNPPCRRSPPRP